MSIVANPMLCGEDFEGEPEKEEGSGLKICQNGSFETQLGHSEGGVGEMREEEMREAESKMDRGEVENQEVEKDEVEKKEVVMEKVKEEKMFADSCVQTGPPSFRMVRFKQEAAGPGIR